MGEVQERLDKKKILPKMIDFRGGPDWLLKISYKSKNLSFDINSIFYFNISLEDS